VKRPDRRPSAEEILSDLGARPRLTIYLGYAPGTGKTHRLLTEARAMREAGKSVALGWVDTKDRADLEQLVDGLPRIPARESRSGAATFEDFDLDAALASDYQTIVLDELAHTNAAGGRNVKRWEDALALRRAGKAVIGAFNIAHLESVAPTAEALIGFPVREIVPLSFLHEAEQVVAVDASLDQIQERLREGRIVRLDDVERAMQGAFRPQTLRALRAMLLQTVDEIARERGEADEESTAVALIPPNADAMQLAARAALLADAMNLALVLVPTETAAAEPTSRIAKSLGARLQPAAEQFEAGALLTSAIPGSLLALPDGELAKRVLAGPLDRDVLVVDLQWAAQKSAEGGAERLDYAFGHTMGDRQKRGYGKLTVYLGAAAGCGKTYAMLDRGQQLRAEGVDIVAGFVETHGRIDTQRMLDGLELLPRKTVEAGGVAQEEFDLDGLLARRPQVALIDELAHTNAPGSRHPKRYQDVLTVVRAGISVITTLNVQHLDGLNDVVRRLTGVSVRETIADGVLEFADEVVLIDASPQTLRERLRAGKIYPRERVEAALASFFQVDNLLALRELALREAMRTRRTPVSAGARIGAMLLGVSARVRDVYQIRRCARLASRLRADLKVMHVARPRTERTPALAELEAAAAEAGAEWLIAESERPVREMVRRSLVLDAMLVIEGARGKVKILGGLTFARRALEEGVVQMLALRAPSDGDVP
jgi:two-component system, OmpR family, sensor histidine kinase KdpD